MSDIGQAGAKLLFDGMLAGLEMTRGVKMSKTAREEIELLKIAVRAIRDNPNTVVKPITSSEPWNR